MPYIQRGKGGPAKEVWKKNDKEYFVHVERKAFDVTLFNKDDNWRKYLRGEVWPKTRVYDVALFMKNDQDDECGLDEDGNENNDDENENEEGDNGIEQQPEDDSHEVKDPPHIVKIKQAQATLLRAKPLKSQL